MSWQTVRHLERMEPLRLLIRSNRAVQENAPAEIREAIEEIAAILQEVMHAVRRGRPLE